MGPGSEMVAGRSSNEDAPPTTSSATPTSLRLLTGSQLHAEDSAVDSQEPFNTFGVQSLQEDDVDSLPSKAARKARSPAPVDDQANRIQSAASRSLSKPRSRRLSVSSDVPSHAADSSPSRLPTFSQAPSIAHSLASLSLDSQAPLSSAPSSPKSTSQQSLGPTNEGGFRDSNSEAIASDEEIDASNNLEMENSAPQLVMPSIKMPSRRPFTSTGKDLGKLKILLAGAKGAGKTSLIKSIVQTCDDIVHIDSPLPSEPRSDRNALSQSSSKKQASNRPTLSVSEVYASTRPYPTWWANLDSSSMLRKRKSMGDLVLERNLCFVDTPGHDKGISRVDIMDQILQYIGDQVKRSFSPSSGGDIVSLLSGQGGCQVDLVLFLLSQGIREEDIIFLRRLSPITNVIVLISKSDLISFEEAEIMRRSVTEKLQSSGVEQFSFLGEDDRQAPFNVCSIPTEDQETMDASLLMSSEYVQPLVPSDLGVLLRQIFDKDVASRLRHVAATKISQAQNSFSATAGSFAGRTSSNPPSDPSTVQVMGKQTNAGISPILHASLTQHTQREERLARIRLAKWAADLQRSLQNERERCEALAHDEQAAWLNRKLSELSGEPDSAARDGQKMYQLRRSYLAHRTSSATTHDPLGLLRWQDFMTQRGWLAVQIAGGFGILGGIAVWVARAWSAGNENWTWTWSTVA